MQLILKSVFSFLIVNATADFVEDIFRKLGS